MRPNPYGSNAYSQASMNVSPMKAVIMLYEGAIRFVSDAKRADEAGDFEGRFNAIDRASKVILGLQGQLDFEKGGDISPMLHEFYDSLFLRMMQANSRNAGPIFDDVLESLTIMKKTWQTVADEIGSNPGARGTSNQDQQVIEKISSSIASTSINI